MFVGRGVQDLDLSTVDKTFRIILLAALGLEPYGSYPQVHIQVMFISADEFDANHLKMLKGIYIEKCLSIVVRVCLVHAGFKIL